jgi:uncharacterized repeat protein (TIGR03803 family)
MKRKTSIMLVASALFVIFPSVRVHAQTFATLYTFTGGADGRYPGSGLIFDSQGNLYGVTYGTYGGTTNFGTVFEMSPISGDGWTLDTIYTFQGGADGANPQGNLVFDRAGNLYGTTVFGGGCGVNNPNGCGTVFELSPIGSGGWQKTTIYRFEGGMDAAGPSSGLAIDEAGNLYGATAEGGLRYGTVFELSPTAGGWSETVLHLFVKLFAPQGGLVLDAKGNLYGTASNGGPTGCGGVFELTPASGSWNLKVLHAFGCGSDGDYPSGTLASDSLGRIYGVTARGGAFKDGTVYLLTPRAGSGWASRVIHSFNGADGLAPFAGVTVDEADNIYGTTQVGGSSQNCTNGCGVAYKLTATSSGSWNHSILHIFTAVDGDSPSSALILDNVGNLFGTTSAGGIGNFGTVFEITPN